MPLTDNQKRDIVKEVINNSQYLCLATSSTNGIPWATPLMFATDQKLNFYWTSALDAVHSQNLAENPKAAIVIYDSHPVTGKAQALYCQVEVSPLKGDDLTRGCEVFYTMRYPDPVEREKNGRASDDFKGTSPRRLYRAVATSFSVLEPDKHPIHGKLVDHRVEVSMDQS